ncbi:MAG: hypothetical protein ACWA5U_06030 [bacterium]
MKFASCQILLVIALLFSSLLISSNTSAEAVVANDEYFAPDQQSASQSKEVIDLILSGEEFSQTTTREVWQFKDTIEFEDELDDFGIAQDILKAISILFKFIVITALIVAVILLIYYRKQWVGLLKRKRNQKESFTAPDILFGMDIRPESLPDNIPATAQQLWQLGDHRAALSLLYRGALMYLIQYAHLPLEQSHTEGDVLKISYQSLIKGNDLLNNNPNHDYYMLTHTYLKNLTQAWQTIAYAQRLPNEDSVKHLFSHWQTEFQKPLYDYQEEVINNKMARST